MLSWEISGNPPPPAGEPQMYLMSFPKMEVPWYCPVKECKGGALTRTGLHVYFLHRYGRDSVFILKEVNLYHPR